jgi:prenyltransferase beta subunit
MKSIQVHGGYDDYEVNNLDTTLALLALKKIKYPNLDTIGYALGYLLSTQNPDGGFGFYAGDKSNVYMTTIVLQALLAYKGTFNIQNSINNAVSYLLTKQNPDGGFGSSASTVYETALALEALIVSGVVGADK